MAHVKPDYEILVGVKGGGQIAGESGKKIESQLNSIFGQLNKNSQSRQILFGVNEKSISGGLTTIVNKINTNPSFLPNIKLNIDTNHLTKAVKDALENMPAVKLKVALDSQGSGSSGGGKKRTTLDQALATSASWQKMIMGLEKELYTAGLPSERRNAITAAIRLARSNASHERSIFLAQNRANASYNQLHPNDPKRPVYSQEDLAKLTPGHQYYYTLPDFVRAEASLAAVKGSAVDMYAQSKGKVSAGTRALAQMLTRLQSVQAPQGSQAAQLVTSAIQELQGVQTANMMLNHRYGSYQPPTPEALKSTTDVFNAHIKEIERVTKLANEAEKNVTAATKKAAAAQAKQRGNDMKALVDQRKSVIKAEQDLAHLQKNPVANAKAIATQSQVVAARRSAFNTSLAAYEPDAKKRAAVQASIDAKNSVKAMLYAKTAKASADTDAAQEKAYTSLLNIRKQMFACDKDIARLKQDEVKNAEEIKAVEQRRADLQKQFTTDGRAYRQAYGVSSAALMNRMTADVGYQKASFDVDRQAANGTDAQRNEVYQRTIALREKMLRTSQELNALKASDVGKDQKTEEIAQKTADFKSQQLKYSQHMNQTYGAEAKVVAQRVEQEKKIVELRSTLASQKADQQARQADAQRVKDYKQLVELVKQKVRWENEGYKFTNRDKGTAIYREWEARGLNQNAYGAQFNDKIGDYISKSATGYAQNYGLNAQDIERQLRLEKDYQILLSQRSAIIARTTVANDKHTENSIRAFIKLQERAQKYLNDNGEALSAKSPETYARLSKFTDNLYDFDAKTGTPADALAKHFGGDYKKALDEMLRIEAITERINGTQLTMGQKIVKTFKEKFGFGVMSAAAMYARRAIMQLYTNVVELDDAMAQMKIVTGASAQALKDYSASAADAAKATGRTMTEIMSSSTEYARLGYNLEEALALSETTAKLSNVADIETAEATTAMTAILKGFRLEAKDAEMVGDMMTKVANEYAIDAGELGAALERGGASLAAANNSLAESMALMAAGNAAIQNAETVGKQHCPAA